MWFYGLFSSSIDDKFFEIGKLYNIKKKGNGKTTLFWKARTDGNFLKSATSIPNGVPLIYIGIHESYASKFHLFLYGDKKVFTIGLINQLPETYFEKTVRPQSLDV